IDALLDPALHVVDGAGQVHGLDVVPGPLVRNDREHSRALLGDDLFAPHLLCEPGEVLVGYDKSLALSRRALVLQLSVDLVEVGRDRVWRRRRARDPAVPPAY